jgi:sugar phosphate isomerase/epimerase
MMLDEPLLATCWTTAGDAAPLRGDERSPLPLRARIEAAADAGFRGFGMTHVDLVRAERDYGIVGIRAMLDDHGFEHRELEFLSDWWTAGEARARSDRVRRDLLEAAEALDARHVKVGPDFSNGPWELDHWAGELAKLAAEAHEAGTKIAVEFLPWSNIKTVHDGLRLVEAAAHPAAGLIIDVWHTERAHTPPAELAEIPLERIFGVELSDADALPVGTLFEDTANRRRLCGEGAFDLPGVVTALRKAGWRGPWGVEILSEEHRHLDVRAATARAFTTAVRVLNRTVESDYAPPGRAAT